MIQRIPLIPHPKQGRAIHPRSKETELPSSLTVKFLQRRYLMKAFSSRHYKCLFIAASLVLLLALTFSACNSASSTTTTTTSRGRGSNSVPTTTGPAPQVKPGTQPCPEAVKDPSYWDPIIATQANVSKVESVSCANMVGNSSLQALISVRYYGTGQPLDVYIYNNITDPSPTQIFQLQNLY